MQYDTPDSRLLTDIRNNLPETIRVFDPGEFFPPTTKADFGLPVDIQSDALDYDNASALSNSLYDYVQIPVNAVTPLTYTTVRLPDFIGGTYPSKTAQSKVFLVVQFPKDSSEKERIGIITIVPHPDFMTREQLDSLDFFYDGHFNAVFLYTDIYGDFKKAEIYIQGAKYRECTIAELQEGDTPSAVLTPVTVSRCDSDGAPRQTSDDDYYDLPEVVCIGYTDDWLTWPNEDEDHISNSHNHFENDTDTQSDFPRGGGRQPTCKVIVSQIGRGEVSGEGEYTALETVICKASPHMAGDIPTSEFIHWTGDIASFNHTVSFLARDFMILGQVSLTAVFHNFNPCADEENDRRDPLREMKIQASGAGGWNIEGGTFGWTRNRGATQHKGMDFACPVGTPVFATHDGIVKNIRTGFTNGEKWEDYQKRTGVGNDFKNTFGCGNGVDIECTINGRTYIVHYWHLTSAYGNLTVGESVKAGDIIGISGNSGSAAEDSSGGPHLHYQIDGAGQPVNPSSFIYAIFDNKWRLTNPCN